MRGILIAVAVASLICASTWNVASAAGSRAAAGNTVQAGTKSGATHTKTTKKSKRSKVERPQTNWLNPQPEPPLPASKTPVQGGNWLNPQPEPPRPDTTKKVH